MDLFKQINEKFNRTLIMVTHNMELLEYASKVIRILDGKVVEVKENLKPKNKVMGMMADLVDLVGSEIANPAAMVEEVPQNAEEAIIQAKLQEKMKKEGKK
jgi:ABC-type methionine transport system ATPase subunit